MYFNPNMRDKVLWQYWMKWVPADPQKEILNFKNAFFFLSKSS